MNHRDFGTTGWRVSEIGFGAWGIAVFLVVAALLLVANTIRLTALGRVVVAALVAATCLALLVIAARSASPSHAAGPAVRTRAVTVRTGDTLWSIATRVAPERDPRAEVDDLVRLNHLAGVDLVPGQVLRLH